VQIINVDISAVVIDTFVTAVSPEVADKSGINAELRRIGKRADAMNVF
jgi:hypothetical protein